MEKGKVTLTERFIMLSRLMMHIHHHGRGAGGHSPYRGQGRILSLLKLEPEMSQKKLSYLLGIRPQSMGELLAKLEQAGYITRTSSETDRRSLEIRLTEEGRAAAVEEESQQEKEHSADGIFQCLEEAEQLRLAEYLDRVIASLQEKMTEEQKEFFENHMHHPHSHHHPHPRHSHHGCRMHGQSGGSGKHREEEV